MKQYVIGLDYGTLSGRCVLVDAESGEEVAESVSEYAHGVMDETLPDGQRLPPQWALQHPQDYLDVLSVTVPDVLKKANVAPECVRGMGIDFTACTILPLNGDGTPLCLLPEWEHEKHAMSSCGSTMRHRDRQIASTIWHTAGARTGSTATAESSPRNSPCRKSCSFWRKPRRSTVRRSGLPKPATGSPLS